MVDWKAVEKAVETAERRVASSAVEKVELTAEWWAEMTVGSKAA